MKRNILTTYTLLILLALTNTSQTNAYTMQNSDYILKTDPFSTFRDQTIQINSANDKSESPPSNNTQNNEIEKQIPVEISSTNRPVTGIPSPLLIESETNAIDFGELNPGEPVIRKANITVQGGSPLGYQVLTYEEKSLTKSETDETIPDTTCDTGTCTQTTPAIWKNPLTFGFGYSCESKIKHSCIINSQNNEELFMQFANKSENELPQPVFKSFSQDSTIATLIYKANIAPSQSSGTYTTTIHFIATPIL